MAFAETKRELALTVLLVVAAVFVGISILTEGGLSTTLNGMAGVLWFVVAVGFVIEARSRGTTARQWLLIIVLTALVAFVVRPSDFLLASIGFVIAGTVASAATNANHQLLAKLVPALYLPMHVGTAMIRVAIDNARGIEAGVRTEPPPTAALVPLVMIVAAVLGGVLGAQLARKIGKVAPAGE